MYKFLLCAVMIGVLAGSGIAAAQNREHHDEASPRHEEHGDRRGPEQRAPEARHDESRGSNEFRGREHGAQRENTARGGNEFRGHGERSDFDRHAGRERERRDFSGVRNFHRNFRAPRHFRGGRYHAPRGYFARRWRWGEVLPSAFWAREYWIPDFAAYDLPPPPFDAVWVRVGDDALLIDDASGEIIEVDYGVFY